MTTKIPPSQPRRDRVKLVLSIVAFGLLMGFRDSTASIWLRALMAGSAFAILFLAANSLKKPGSLAKP